MAFLASPLFSVGITYINKNILKVSDFQYGMVESVFVSSMLVAPFLSSIIGKKVIIGKMLYYDILIVSTLMLCMAVVPFSPFLHLFSANTVPYIVLVSLVFLVGLVVNVANIAIGAFFQKQVPLHMMGRVGTVLSSISMGAIPLGQMVFGIMYDHVAASICVLLPSLILLFFTLAAMRDLDKADTEKIEGRSAVSKA